MGLFRFIKNIFSNPAPPTTPAPSITLIHKDSLPVTPPVSLPDAVETVPHDFPVIVAGTIDCNDDELQMVKDAFTDLNKVISTPLFKQLVLEAHFTETNGDSNQAVYDLLVRQSPLKVDFTMFMGDHDQNYEYLTMGLEDDGYPGVCFANRFFVQDKETCASLILHESAHILGFHHYNKVTSTSIPYTLNDIYDQVARSLGLE